MFIHPREIARNIEWLQQTASPAVRFLTHRDLLHADPASADMQSLWREVEADPDVKRIFALQLPNGAWFSGGPWGPRGYRRQTGEGYTSTRPKFVTTAWLLPFLGEIGYRAEDPRIRKAAGIVLAEMPTDGQPESICGLEGITLCALSSIGLATDPRLEPAWRRLLHAQRPDGGWLHPFHLADAKSPCTTKGRWPWNRSCAWGSYYAARALHEAWRTADGPVPTVRSPADERNTPPAGSFFGAAPLAAAAGFLHAHLSAAPEEAWRTWAYHGHNLVRELELYLDAGLPMDTPLVRTALAWLATHHQPEDGRFQATGRSRQDSAHLVSELVREFDRTKGSEYWEQTAKVSLPVLRYTLYHLAEDDWLTFRLTRLAMKLESRTYGGETA